MLERAAEEVIRTAVKGMLPKNRLARQLITKLKMYAGPEHPHEPRRSPQPLELASHEATRSAQYRGTGKRKTSVARVILEPGDGKITVNGRTLEEYFPRGACAPIVSSPLETAGRGQLRRARPRRTAVGITGQAGAVRHGIARALVEANPELRTALKREGFLTRDAREVERKKAGLKGARRRPQFSKR